MEDQITIGQLLKSKREEKNISLEVVAQKTKININLLKSLEEDELDKLPNKTYVKGFVANYAKTVGLDQEEAKSTLLATYKNLLNIEETEDPTQTNLGSLQNENELVEESEELKETFLSIVQSFFSKKVLTGLAVVLVLFGVGKAVVGFFSQLNYESTVDKNLKSEDTNILEMEGNKKFAQSIMSQETENLQEDLASTNSEEVETEKEEVTEADSPDAPEEKKEEPVQEEKVEVAEAEPKKKELPAGKLPFKKFYNAPLNTFEVMPNAIENTNPELLPNNIKSSLVADKQNVYIIATEGDTWISYQIDNEPIKKYVLKQGRRVLLRGDVIKLFMGNYNVTKVFYNNQLIKAYTKTGVKSLIFPNEAARGLKLPLFPTYKGKSYTSADYIEKMVESL